MTDWRQRLARAGLVARGTLYGIVGVVAIAVSLGEERKPADQSGALASLADSGAGEALLVLLAAGLGAYSIFNLIEFVAGPGPDEREEGGGGKLGRAAHLARALVYGGLCFVAVRLLADAGSGSGGEKSATSTVFDLPAGVALVFAAGAVLVAVGGYQAYLSTATEFEDELDTEQMGGRMRSSVRVIGVAGHAARAVVYFLIGGFLIKAAIEHDAGEAIGLDGALRETSQQALGPLLLFLLAFGLLSYGLFSIVEARYRQL